MLHSPGPWKVAKKYGKTEEPSCFPSIYFNEKRRVVINESHDQKRESIEANAFVMGASPELLEACERMFRSLAAYLDYERSDDTHHYYEPKEALELGRSAIRKARNYDTQTNNIQS